MSRGGGDSGTVEGSRTLHNLLEIIIPLAGGLLEEDGNLMPGRVRDVDVTFNHHAPPKKSRRDFGCHRSGAERRQIVG